MRLVTVALSALVLAFAGCGGDDEDSGNGGGTTTGGGAAETATAEPAASEGKELFAGTCGSCHTLADAGTSGTLGPNLDELKPDAERVKNAIASGPGAMPENLFEGAEADAVAEYVAGAAGS